MMYEINNGPFTIPKDDVYSIQVIHTSNSNRFIQIKLLRNKDVIAINSISNGHETYQGSMVSLLQLNKGDILSVRSNVPCQYDLRVISINDKPIEKEFLDLMEKILS